MEIMYKSGKVEICKEVWGGGSCLSANLYSKRLNML